MATKKKSGNVRKKSTTSATYPTIIYIHGIGNQDPEDVVKRTWDLALFGKDMGDHSKMAYWADILHGNESAESSSGLKKKSLSDADQLDAESLLADAKVKVTKKSREYAEGILSPFQEQSGNMRAKVLPLPSFLRKPLARLFLKAFVKDTAAYFFTPGIREKVQERLRKLLGKNSESDSVIIVAHSQGSVIALEVLADLEKNNSTIKVDKFITIGSPLGVTEIQDNLTCGTHIPKKIVGDWYNFADPVDPVALDKGIGNDFDDPGFIIDNLILNSNTLKVSGFNPHSAVGYLANPRVREIVHRSVKFDMQARFLVARDVAENLCIETRQPVLIEILEPGYWAVGEKKEETIGNEKKELEKIGKSNPSGTIDLKIRIENAANEITKIVKNYSKTFYPTMSEKKVEEEACVDTLKRFVSAKLYPGELEIVARNHKNIRIYAIWKNSVKRKLLKRSPRVIQADAAWASYKAHGEGIRWAVLDTGVRMDHPHFLKNNTIVDVWDCTRRGKPQKLNKENHKDKDGHGSHVSGIIAGSNEDGTLQGIAPKAKLVVYKVLNERGEGEDSWMIKALDHISEQNENNSDILIHGLNMSIGGPYDSTVYGCGHSPVCVELRRLWRAGVLVVLAAGNEGQLEVKTPDGKVEINTPMSIGDPANLEDSIVVGSVNADKPHLYGVSSFSSRGPTSDGRVKPDVVAPGERIKSCNSQFKKGNTDSFYRDESGTSMAAPHISGLLAAFLSVRPEFKGRPDEVKQILLRTCTDIRRDKYHQGSGVPNLMQMLLET